jgi:predicted aldo/keto reductase-like oxidoreductase
MSQPMDRRDFIKAGAGVAAATAVGGVRAARAAKTTDAEVLRMVKLPRGGHEVPVIGCGCAPLVRLLREDRRDEAIRIIQHAYEVGMRFFDSANLYRIDPTVGEAIREFTDDIYMATKTAAIGPDGPAIVRRQVEEELRRYNRDVLDCVKVHNAYRYDWGMLLIDELEKLKAEGKVRNIGMSTHIHFETAFKMIDTGRLDEVLLAKCYFPKGMIELVSQRNAEFRELAIARAHELGMNITGMKALGSTIFDFRANKLVPDFGEEKLARLPAAAIRWALSDTRFQLYAVGVARMEDVDANIALCRSDLELTNRDRELLAEFSARAWNADIVKSMQEPYKYPDSGPYREPAVISVGKSLGLTEDQLFETEG